MNLSLLPQAAALTLAALSAALPARAQPAADPYRPAFDAVRPHTDPQPLDWRAANARMAELGGHAGHLRAAGGLPVAASVPGDGQAADPAPDHRHEGTAPVPRPPATPHSDKHPHHHGRAAR